MTTWAYTAGPLLRGTFLEFVQEEDIVQDLNKPGGQPGKLVDQDSDHQLNKSGGQPGKLGTKIKTAISNFSNKINDQFYSSFLKFPITQLMTFYYLNVHMSKISKQS